MSIADCLAALLNDLINNQEVRTSLATNMEKLGHLDAAEQVCLALEGLVQP